MHGRMKKCKVRVQSVSKSQWPKNKKIKTNKTSTIIIEVLFVSQQRFHCMRSYLVGFFVLHLFCFVFSETYVMGFFTLMVNF